MVFSSAAGTIGASGQGVYGAANPVSRDELVSSRHQGRQPGKSPGLGLWKQMGIGDDGSPQ